MEVIRSVVGARAACERFRGSGESIGLVPTMGALHEGHASLLRRARKERGAVVMTLFVNPLQFEDAADLAAYPRDEPGDLEAADRLGVDLVFAPRPEEMFPGGPPDVTIDVGSLGERLEGASRPGHFRGVATVVARLFNIVGPARSYFGEKDAQQLAVVRRMVRDLAFPVEIVACPTVREADGLALSSRNRRLGRVEREAAGCLFLALSEAAELARGGERDAAAIVAAMAREVGATPLARLDYAAVVDDETFEDVRALAPGREARALVAASFGATRLIDNIRLPRSLPVREDGASPRRAPPQAGQPPDAPEPGS
jgi:pantoate--beta-alanine ligase